MQPDVQNEPCQPRSILDDVRVVELGTFLSAPFAAALLADFGAEVLKIELPGVGDPMRTLGKSPPGGGSGYWWASIARNKRSVELDIRTPEGRDILGELLTSTDILIENFRPGTLEKWGITPEWLQDKRPDLIVVRISGYGQDGPWRDVPGFDRNAQAFSGLVYVTGEPDGPPQQAGLPVCDFTAGLWASFGAAMAIIGRLRGVTEGGNVVDLALYETMLPFLKEMPQTYRNEGIVNERSGNTPGYVAPGGSYMTGDGEWIFISGTGDRVFARLMKVIGRPDMIEDPRYRENMDRVAHRADIDTEINAWLAARGTEAALDALVEGGVPAVKINSIADLMNHPQVQARENFVALPDGERGTAHMAAPVPRLAKNGGMVRWPGERLGQSTEAVLRDRLNIDPARLEELRARGVVG